MAYPGAKQIGVHFEFPGGDRSQPPYVTNDTNEIDEIGAESSSIEWSAYSLTDDQSLTITGVTFYSDSSKTSERTPAYFGTGFNNGRYNWIVPFREGVAVPAEETLVYTLHFKDAEYSDLTWDPTLKIKPRAAGQAAGAAG